MALAAIGGGVGAGLKAGPLGDINGAAGGAIRGALGNMITQGIGVATGLRDKFSWAGVAAAGASGAVIGHFGLPSLANNPSAADIATYATVSGAAAIASAATRSLIEGSDFGDNIMAALPDVIGQTIGEAIAGGIAGRGRSSAALDEQGSTSAGYEHSSVAGKAQKATKEVTDIVRNAQDHGCCGVTGPRSAGQRRGAGEEDSSGGSTDLRSRGDRDR